MPKNSSELSLWGWRGQRGTPEPGQPHNPEPSLFPRMTGTFWGLRRHWPLGQMLKTSCHSPEAWMSPRPECPCGMSLVGAELWTHSHCLGTLSQLLYPFPRGTTGSVRGSPCLGGACHGLSKPCGDNPGNGVSSVMFSPASVVLGPPLSWGRTRGHPEKAFVHSHLQLPGQDPPHTHIPGSHTGPLPKPLLQKEMLSIPEERWQGSAGRGEARAGRVGQEGKECAVSWRRLLCCGGSGGMVPPQHSSAGGPRHKQPFKGRQVARLNPPLF